MQEPVEAPEELPTGGQRKGSRGGTPKAYDYCPKSAILSPIQDRF